MKFRLLSATAIAMMAAMPNAVSAAPDAKALEIIKKSEAAMKSAKTYQAVMEMSMDMGQMGAVKMNMDMKVITGKKMSMKMTPIGTPTGAMAMGAAQMNMQMVDDGTNLYTYMPAMKQYSKAPSQAKTADATAMMKNAKGADFKYLKEEMWEGKPALVLQGTTAGRQGQQTMMMYIDKATYRFRGMAMNQKGSNPQGQQMEMKMKMTVKNEQVNAAIPDSVFKFTPPAGATEAKGGMRPGGMLGGPGGK